MTVSIIIPVYNVEKNVSDCIQSVLLQSYDEIEVIIVNDGSTDNSGIICEKIAKSDHRIKYFEKENGGLSSARNFGLRHATGDYIFFLDSDDYLKLNAIESLVDELYHSNCDIVSSAFLMVDEKQNSTQKVKEVKYCRGDNTLFLFQKISNQACGKLYRKDLFNGISYPLNMHYEDIATTFKLYDKANVISYTDCGLYCYRVRSGAITYTITSHDIDDMWKAYEIICNYFNNPTMNQQFYKATVLYTIYSRLLRSCCDKDRIMDDENKIYSEFKRLNLDLEEFREKSDMYIKLKLFNCHLTKPIIKIIDIKRKLF